MAGGRKDFFLISVPVQDIVLASPDWGGPYKSPLYTVVIVSDVATLFPPKI